MRVAVSVLALAVSLLVTMPQARVGRGFRAVWVDTFNSTINNHADVRQIVDRARAARLNAILVQVRRRGDAWYLQSLEPPPDFIPIERGFDPLADLIATAHVSGIEVHAFVIIGAIWHKDPALPPPANGLPQDERHAFRRYSGYDPSRRVITQGPDNWLTRTLLPDGPGITYQGHRIGSDFWLDFGHPAAAAYTVDVLAHLVRHYDIDGLHLDRIRYPELAVAGQTPTSGASIGYNAVSLARFNRRHLLPPDAPPPSPGDGRWADWRRTQVTNLVRRIYLTTAAIKPQLPVSAALIAFGGAPASVAAWPTAEAYWRVYQDWREWLAEGIVDVAIPMLYRREHDAVQARQYDEWNAWLGSLPPTRCTVSGIGAYLNGIEGTLRQVRRTPARACGGIALFSLAGASEALAVNPWSRPPGSSTPRLGFDELASALVGGFSMDGRTAYEDPSLAPVHADEALPPVLPWKLNPTTGHLMGIARQATGAPFDTVPIYIVRRGTRDVRTIETDGNGFFGAVDLDPGEYDVTLLTADVWLRQTTTVAEGRVSEVRLGVAR
ncbi:MAG: family 10 glycosylhydrolase [Acidobacteriota bacterium]